MTMDARYVKTEAGRAEMKERRLALPRQARLLLVIIDASKTSADWVAAVHGSSDADIERLLAAGLIEPHAGAARAGAAASAPVAAPACPWRASRASPPPTCRPSATRRWPSWCSR
jgi:hypothetical protein